MSAVPPEFCFDLFDDAVKADPYPHYDAMRATGRVVSNPMMLGQFMVPGYDDVVAMLQDPATFSNAMLGGGMTGGASVFQAPTMLNSDPPDHERLRGPVARAFTPKSVSQLEPRMREIAAHLVAPLRDGEALDVVAGLGERLPVLIIAEMLGVSTDDLDDFVRWSHGLMAVIDPMSPPERMAHGRECSTRLFDYFEEEVKRRRDRPTTDDLVGRLVEANTDGLLSDAELLSACVLLLLGGNETTTKLITNMTLALGRNPGERARIVEDPALVPTAVDEAMRYDTPVQANGRVTTRDVDLGGFHLPKGSLVMGLLAAANRDPARFDDPHRFDAGRDPNPHVGFSRGIHHCLGASLARLEGRAALTALLEAAPAFGVRTTALEYRGTFFFHAPAELVIARE